MLTVGVWIVEILSGIAAFVALGGLIGLWGEGNAKLWAIAWFLAFGFICLSLQALIPEAYKY